MAAKKAKPTPTRKATATRRKPAQVASHTPKKSTPMLPDAVIAEQLKKSHGNISHSALSLGITRTALSARVQRTPELKEVCDDSRQSIVDAAENSLMRAVVKGEAWATCFTLKTIGKDRGYIERQEVENAGAIEVIVRRENRVGTTSEN